jgi:hypothetical protein
MSVGRRVFVEQRDGNFHQVVFDSLLAEGGINYAGFQFHQDSFGELKVCQRFFLILIPLVDYSLNQLNQVKAIRTFQFGFGYFFYLYSSKVFKNWKNNNKSFGHVNKKTALGGFFV